MSTRTEKSGRNLTEEASRERTHTEKLCLYCAEAQLLDNGWQEKTQSIQSRTNHVEDNEYDDHMRRGYGLEDFSEAEGIDRNNGRSVLL